MATKGTAAKSATGASMSKYDVEVEARLQALEAKAHAKCEGGGGDVAALAERLEKVVAALKMAAPGSTKDL
jgi:hypothetical protein|tara:strand:- start:736 stop:948 length:213 start_codon:yes stop_codon:yes gene_type:complete